MKPSLRRSLRRIESQFDELEAVAARPEVQVERISAWSVRQHLDHMLQVDRTVARRLEVPETGQLPPISAVGWLLLTAGWIPRGRGKAPAAVIPAPAPPAELEKQVPEVRALLAAELASEDRFADPRPIARHPVFGGLSAERWVRFVEVHHRHHLKITRDIERAGAT
jgi:hypothetical protein